MIRAFVLYMLFAGFWVGLAALDYIVFAIVLLIFGLAWLLVASSEVGS